MCVYHVPVADQSTGVGQNGRYHQIVANNAQQFDLPTSASLQNNMEKGCSPSSALVPNGLTFIEFLVQLSYLLSTGYEEEIDYI